MTYLVNRRAQKPFDIFEEVFNSSFFDRTSDIAIGSKFPVDVEDKGNAIQVKAEIPGVNKSDLHIEYDNGIVTIKAEKKSEKEEKTETSSYREIRTGSFERRINVGDVDWDKTKAVYENGVLNLDIPKLEAKKPKVLQLK